MDQSSPSIGRSLFFSAPDGLRLHGRIFDAPGSSRPPVLCLAGLTRNSRDFLALAQALSSGEDARTVHALDSRGRGLSAFDPKWQNYTIQTEMQDVIDFATVTGLHGATVVGTSRGGLIAMGLAAVQPGIIGAVVLNDIGPVIERDGLARIAGYVGRTPLPGSWAEAAQMVAGMSKGAFPTVPDSEWDAVARAWFNEKDGRPAPGYDPAIGKTMTPGATIPELWPQFQALGGVPMLVIRGELSDILGAPTVAEMQARHPDCAALTVAGQGHAPLLRDAATIDAIQRFIAAAERIERVAGRDFGGAAA